ncbi:redox-sensitive transcriptional activator SoxR [Naumannella cuiyingiana]|uniref:MerR family redox-sensitive transcriptional activator SoxR n=1 Tax=Naumannella cuiyingiana TaxID=1347891 RepID=A0A7Z0IMH8_9ACTN|nr:MerR family redox-sensitive transcriptional activator SoxR [Naumannella cuiyingiana]
MPDRNSLSIGELAERSGLAHSALRFYEQHGLLSPERNAANQRRYPRSELRRIAFIRSAQRVGLTLGEIRTALASLPSGRTPTRADWRQLSESWRPRLNEQIRRLEELRDRLDTCIGCGCLSLSTCALSNPEDRAHADGPGAVYMEHRIERG